MEPIRVLLIDGIAIAEYEGPRYPLATPTFWIIQGTSMNGATMLPSLEGAIERAKQTAFVQTYTEVLAGTREDYEDSCANAGLPAWSDEEIQAKSYSLKYGDYFLGQNSPETVVANTLAGKRLIALEQERDPSPPPSNAQFAAASGFVQISGGDWIGEEEWLESQEVGLDP